MRLVRHSHRKRGETDRPRLRSTAPALDPTAHEYFDLTGTAVSQYVDRGHPDVIAAVQAQQPEIALFALLETLPLANVASFIGLVLIVVFFVTSSDSGSLVIDTITAGGKLDAPVAQRVFWCVLEGLVAIALLLGGGLVAAQAATLAVLPPSSVATPYLNANVSWPACVGERQ